MNVDLILMKDVPQKRKDKNRKLMSEKVHPACRLRFFYYYYYFLNVCQTMDMGLCLNSVIIDPLFLLEAGPKLSNIAFEFPYQFETMPLCFDFCLILKILPSSTSSTTLIYLKVTDFQSCSLPSIPCCPIGCTYLVPPIFLGAFAESLLIISLWDGESSASTLKSRVLNFIKSDDSG